MNKRSAMATAVCILAFCAGNPARGNDVPRFQAWVSSSALPRIPQDLTPTLPAPVLVREPEFTWGLSNTLHWSSDSVLKTLRPLNVTLLFFEIQASHSGREWWGFVDIRVDSATFDALPEGVPVEFRLRYYGKDASGAYLVSQWSLPQKSIQDNHAPVLQQWEIAGLQKTVSGNWVQGQVLSIRISAIDTSGGKIMEAVLREVGPAGDHILHYDFQRPQTRFDTTLIYSVHAPPNLTTQLRIQIKDVSGQVSKIHSLDFFWWPADDASKVICFPNPFNPERGQWSTIKIEGPGFTEAHIFDPFGGLVRILNKRSDQSFFEWDGKNGRGEIVSNGAYLCVVKENQRLYCKIMVRK